MGRLCKMGDGVRVWLVINSSGTFHVLRAGKHEIMRRTCLGARDLRIMDPMLSYPSSILGRERAMVISLEHIKAIISGHEVLVLNYKDPQVAPLVQALRRLQVHKGPARQTVLPFEFRALEACLEAVCSSLEHETITLEQQAYPALDELRSKISPHNLNAVRRIKSQLATLSGRVEKVRDEVEQVLDDDGHMAEMYLTRKLLSRQLLLSSEDEQAGEDDLDQMEATPNAANFPARWEPRGLYLVRGEATRSSSSSSSHAISHGRNVDVQDLEMLLEAYFVQIDGMLHKLAALRDYVDATGDYIDLMLDDKQNQLLEMGLKYTAATLVVSASVVITGIFGMNITIPWFDEARYNTATDLAHFMWVVGSTPVLVLIYCMFIAWCKWQRLLT